MIGRDDSLSEALAALTEAGAEVGVIVDRSGRFEGVIDRASIVNAVLAGTLKLAD